VTEIAKVVEPKQGKLKIFFSDLKVNWHTSLNEGEYLGYKEILSYSFGSSGVSGLGSLVAATSLVSSTILIGSIFKIGPFILYLMTSVITIISLIKTPIISTFMDNTSSNKGKFKPYLIWMGIPTMILISLIPFVPLSWVDVEITKISLGGLSGTLSLAGLMIFILQVLLSLTWPTLYVANGAIGQVITPNTFERAKMYSFHSIINSFWPSIITIFFPMFAILTKGAFDTGQQNILSYRIWFPMFGILSFMFTLITYYNVKERTVVEKDYKPNVKFKDGVRKLGSNKYFWLYTISALFGAIRIAGNLINWINVYSFKSDVVTSITTTVAGNVMIPGMALTGIMVKKFGKRKIMLATGFISAFLYIPMILFPEFPILLLSMIFLQNFLTGFATCGAILPADALDSIQLKSGERLEGFWGMFHHLVLAVAWLGTGLVGPAVLRLSGLTDGAEVLAIDTIRFSVFRNFSIMSGIAALFSVIPFLFWDLSEEKHERIIQELKIIAMEKNEESKQKLVPR
jgi:glycoside/pentoside/hexuronide:cation symporter, GPH family